MKSHINFEGVAGKCSADPSKPKARGCDFAREEDHFNTIGEAREEAARRAARHGQEVNSLKAANERLSKKEEAMRNHHAKLAQKYVENRADEIEGITYDDANPERAKRRLKEAIDFARGQQNEHLIEKLSEASVLQSGAFKLSDGSRANVDEAIRMHASIKLVKAKREMLESVLSAEAQRAFAAGESIDGAKITAKDGSTFTLSIKEGFSQDEFDKLDEKTKERITSMTDSFSIELAREHLSPNELALISQDTSEINYIEGKIKDVSQDSFDKITLQGNTAQERLEHGLASLQKVHETSREVNDGVKFKGLEAGLKESSTAMKAIAAKNPRNTFVPARSQSNGAVINRKSIINRAAALEKLTPEQIKKITIPKPKEDINKAKSVLSQEEYDRVFNAKLVRFLVREK